MFRFARTLELPRLSILSDKEEFAMQLWFKSAEENPNHALCSTVLDNSLLYSPFLFDVWKKKKKKKVNYVKCHILGRKKEN